MNYGTWNVQGIRGKREENDRRKITQNSIENWMPKQMRARGRPKKNWMEGIRKAMNERNLNEGQWEDRKQWSLGVGQRKVWSSGGSTHCNCQLTSLIDVYPWVWCSIQLTLALQLCSRLIPECIVSHVTSVFAIHVSCIVLGTLRTTMTCVRVFFVVQFNGFMSLTS